MTLGRFTEGNLELALNLNATRQGNFAILSADAGGQMQSSFQPFAAVGSVAAGDLDGDGFDDIAAIVQGTIQLPGGIRTRY